MARISKDPDERRLEIINAAENPFKEKVFLRLQSAILSKA